MSADIYVYWLLLSGFLFNTWLAIKLGRLAGILIFAAVVACSITRFTWACGRTHGFRQQRFSPLVYAPKVWFVFFKAAIGSGTTEVTSLGGRGIWRGIGNWTVFPPKEAA